MISPRAADYFKGKHILTTGGTGHIAEYLLGFRRARVGDFRTRSVIDCAALDPGNGASIVDPP